jgi:lipoate---protein ligase
MNHSPQNIRPMTGFPAWRRLPYDVGCSSRHFAASDALVRHAAVGTIWWHSAEEPTLIIGPAQGSHAFDFRLCERENVKIVKRQSGGTAVYAAPDVLGLDVAMPANHPLVVPDIVETYRWLGEIWVETARSLGADAHLVSISEARQSKRGTASHGGALALACFGSLSPYEVVVGRRKLVGLAQVRRRTGTLIQAGIHQSFDAERLTRLLAIEHRFEVAVELNARAIGLNDATGRVVGLEEIMHGFERAFARYLAAELVSGDWSATEIAHCEAPGTHTCSTGGS